MRDFQTRWFYSLRSKLAAMLIIVSLGMLAYPFNQNPAENEKTLLLMAQIPEGLNEIKLEAIYPEIGSSNRKTLQLTVLQETENSSGEVIYQAEMVLEAGTLQEWSIPDLLGVDTSRHLVIETQASKSSPIFLSAVAWNSWDVQAMYALEFENERQDKSEVALTGFNIGEAGAATDLKIRNEISYFYECKHCREVTVNYRFVDLKGRKQFEMHEDMVRSGTSEFHAVLVVNDFIETFALSLSAGYVEARVVAGRTEKGVLSAIAKRSYFFANSKVDEVLESESELPAKPELRKPRRVGSISTSILRTRHLSLSVGHAHVLTHSLLISVKSVIQEIFSAYHVTDDTGLVDYEPVVKESEAFGYPPTPTATPEPCAEEGEYFCVAPDVCCKYNDETGYSEVCDEEAKKCLPPIECTDTATGTTKWCDPVSEKCCAGTDFADCNPKAGSCCPEGGGCEAGKSCCGNFCLNPEKEICCGGDTPKPCDKETEECLDSDKDGEGDLCCEKGKGCGNKCCWGEQICLGDTMCCKGSDTSVYPPQYADELCNGECCAYPKRCWKDSATPSNDGTGMCRNLRLCGVGCDDLSTPCCNKSDPSCGSGNPIFNNCTGITTVGDGH